MYTSEDLEAAQQNTIEAKEVYQSAYDRWKNAKAVLDGKVKKEKAYKAAYQIYQDCLLDEERIYKLIEDQTSDSIKNEYYNGVVSDIGVNYTAWGLGLLVVVVIVFIVIRKRKK